MTPKPATVEATDQAYYAATAENAMKDREVLERRVATAVAGVDESTERLRRGIERIRLVTDRR